MYYLQYLINHRVTEYFHVAKKALWLKCPGPNSARTNLYGFCKDVARLWQEQGRHCLLIGQRRVEVVQHLVQD